ncbi:hypothetical protein [Fodinibius roseus]|nr:hypothetical protein [Fodinibius roseus]
MNSFSQSGFYGAVSSLTRSRMQIRLRGMLFRPLPFSRQREADRRGDKQL